MATPFVQGRLRDRDLEVEIRTVCAHFGDPMVLAVDSELRHRVERGGPNPLVFEPTVDWSTFSEPTIIDGY